MTGHAYGLLDSLSASEQDLPGVVLEQERVGHDEPSNIRMMSRFWRACRAPPTPGCGRWRSDLIVDDLVLGERWPLGTPERAEEAHAPRPRAAPSGRSPWPAPAPQACRGSRTSPSRGCRRRWLRRGGTAFRTMAGSASSVPVSRVPSTSAKKSSMNSLQPSRSPKNSTLVPITGPKSMRTGERRLSVSAARNLGGLRGDDRFVAVWRDRIADPASG